jgi:hypothetical protein
MTRRSSSRGTHPVAPGQAEGRASWLPSIRNRSAFAVVVVHVHPAEADEQARVSPNRQSARRHASQSRRRCPAADVTAPKGPVPAEGQRVAQAVEDVHPVLAGLAPEGVAQRTGDRHLGVHIPVAQAGVGIQALRNGYRAIQLDDQLIEPHRRVMGKRSGQSCRSQVQVDEVGQDAEATIVAPVGGHGTKPGCRASLKLTSRRSTGPSDRAVNTDPRRRP